MKTVPFRLFSFLALFPFFALGNQGDEMLAKYLERRTVQVEESFLDKVGNKEDWDKHKGEYRKRLGYMLGLSPDRPRTDLKATITGKLEGDGFTVENLHYQSSPSLYVTGNLYLPADRKPGQKFPAILYVCGHGKVKKDGVSYGNKVHYQHHGSWFARHGYVCLTIDTIQLGEIEGLGRSGLHAVGQFETFDAGSQFFLVRVLVQVMPVQLGQQVELTALPRSVLLLGAV